MRARLAQLATGVCGTIGAVTVPLVPSRSEFETLARSAPVVPLTKELLADAWTPVAAFAALGKGAGSYLLESVEGGEKWGRYSFVGLEPDMMVRARGERLEVVTERGSTVETHPDPWDGLRAIMSKYRAPAAPWLPRFWGGAVGYVAYDAVRRFEPTIGPRRAGDEDGFDFSFAIGGTVVVFDSLRQTARVVVPSMVRGGDPRAAYDAAAERIERIEAALRSRAALRDMRVPRLDAAVVLPRSSMSRSEYCSAVDRAKEHIAAGDIFQVVLSQRFDAPSPNPDLFDVYRAMRVVNPSPYMFLLRFSECSLAGASPETLVRVAEGIAEVRPIAGTRPRGATPEQDALIEEQLLADPKERAEHVMLVDLGRNDLGRISVPGTVKLTERMLVERYSHVMHIVSNVRGTLSSGRDAIDVLRATFPAGTLSGAPKVRAMQIIDALEPVARGIYGGAIGYIGFGGNLDMAIAIRTIVERGGELTVQAGAGIVEASDPGTEYEETVNKARAALVAIDAARGD